LHFDATSDGFVLEGRHDGYAPFIHTRRFEVSRSRVDIIDRIDGGVVSDAVVGLLLHPDAKATATGSDVRIAIGTHSVILRGTVPFEIESAVWWPDLGTELPTTRLVAHWPGGCATASFTLIIER